MTWEEALQIVVSRTGHLRFLELCEEGWPDHAAYRDLVVRMAAGEPEAPGPTAEDLALRADVVRRPCCGGGVTGAPADRWAEGTR